MLSENVFLTSSNFMSYKTFLLEWQFRSMARDTTYERCKQVSKAIARLGLTVKDTLIQTQRIEKALKAFNEKFDNHIVIGATDK